MHEGITVSWSGGKDSALALHSLLCDEPYASYRVDRLLTTITAGYERVSGHGLNLELLHQQGRRMGIDHDMAYISQQSSMEEYESVMIDAYVRQRDRGVKAIAFGDIHLKGPKKVHLGALRRARMSGVFPLWLHDSRESVQRLIGEGFRAIVICVDTTVLAPSFLGREIDGDFLAELPCEVDPAGENGEYHTFVVDGPRWSGPINYSIGEVVHRDGYAYCDVQAAA